MGDTLLGLLEKGNLSNWAGGQLFLMDITECESPASLPEARNR